jgi:hypothetical protein
MPQEKVSSRRRAARTLLQATGWRARQAQPPTHGTGVPVLFANGNDA